CMSMLRRPRTPLLVPYTTLFRSELVHDSYALKKTSIGDSFIEEWSSLLRFKTSTFVLARAIEAASQTRRPTWRIRSAGLPPTYRSEEHTSELQSRENLVCLLLLE